MTMRTLYLRRTRLPVGSKAWWKAWAKRVRFFPNLLFICLRQSRLRRRGAKLGPLAVVSAKFNGRLENLIVGAEAAVCTAMIALHARVSIGDYAVINDGVTILTATHDLQDPQWKMLTKPVLIGDYAWIAQGATILPGISIGRGAVIGAGAVVTRDVAPFSVVAGNPARVLHTKRTQVLDYSPVAFMTAYEAWLGLPTHSQSWALSNESVVHPGTAR